MARSIDYYDLLAGCAEESVDDGIVIDSHLEPIAGRGAPIKPAGYEGGAYQHDKRWLSTDDTNATDVIVIDNVPSQANRLEEALWSHRSTIGTPEIVLDISAISHLPSHVPRQISSWHFPHRNADSYLRDSQLDGVDFLDTKLGSQIFSATPWSAGPLLAWFPQALLYGFWQSHLGKKRTNTKHARAWVSEIVGWRPAATSIRKMGLKGDPLNLSINQPVTSNPNNRVEWDFGKQKITGGKADKLSEMGHGQVPFTKDSDTRLAPVSFAFITQRASISFAQLRRVKLGGGYTNGDNAALRAILVALGLHAHMLAFGRSFALRSGAELRVASVDTKWLGHDMDETINLGDSSATGALLQATIAAGRARGLPLEGWGVSPIVLRPKENLAKAIVATWPDLDS